MNRRRFCYLMILGGLSIYARPAFANKSSTAIEAPQSVAKGSAVTIRITVTHRGNSSLHYTNWLRVMANQQEIARWNFTASQRPESEVFTREVKMIVSEDVEITAEANCNLHGSAGPTTIKISIKNTGG